jgi:hypothetical protein
MTVAAATHSDDVYFAAFHDMTYSPAKGDPVFSTRSSPGRLMEEKEP